MSGWNLHSLNVGPQFGIHVLIPAAEQQEVWVWVWVWSVPLDVVLCGAWLSSSLNIPSGAWCSIHRHLHGTGGRVSCSLGMALVLTGPRMVVLAKALSMVPFVDGGIMKQQIGWIKGGHCVPSLCFRQGQSHH